MSEPSEIIDTILTALRASADIDNFCVAKWGKVPYVGADFDPENPPETTEYPLIGIDEAKINYVANFSWSSNMVMPIYLSIYVAFQETGTDVLDDVIMAGKKTLLDFMWLVWKAIFETGLDIQTPSEDQMQVRYYPVFCAKLPFVVDWYFES